MKTLRPLVVAISALGIAVVSGCNILDDPGKKKVKYILKDAGSAEFRNARKIPVKPSSNDEVFCGEVNSKNSYGALTGFKKYVVINRSVLIEDGSIAIYDVFEDEPESLRSMSRIAAELELHILKQRAVGKSLDFQLADLRNHTNTESTAYNVTAFGLAWDENCK